MKSQKVRKYDTHPTPAAVLLCSAKSYGKTMHISYASPTSVRSELGIEASIGAKRRYVRSRKPDPQGNSHIKEKPPITGGSPKNIIMTKKVLNSCRNKADIHLEQLPILGPNTLIHRITEVCSFFRQNRLVAFTALVLLESPVFLHHTRIVH